MLDDNIVLFNHSMQFYREVRRGNGWSFEYLAEI